LDPRLRDESIDWVLRCGTYVSNARLKNVVADWGLRENTLFREYAATVNAHGGARWPAARAKPLPFHSRARALLEDLARPALISLRIRAIFGVVARAGLSVHGACPNLTACSAIHSVASMRRVHHTHSSTAPVSGLAVRPGS